MPFTPSYYPLRPWWWVETATAQDYDADRAAEDELHRRREAREREYSEAAADATSQPQPKRPRRSLALVRPAAPVSIPELPAAPEPAAPEPATPELAAQEPAAQELVAPELAAQAPAAQEPSTTATIAPVVDLTNSPEPSAVLTPALIVETMEPPSAARRTRVPSAEALRRARRWLDEEEHKGGELEAVAAANPTIRYLLSIDRETSSSLIPGSSNQASADARNASSEALVNTASGHKRAYVQRLLTFETSISVPTKRKVMSPITRQRQTGGEDPPRYSLHDLLAGLVRVPVARSHERDDLEPASWPNEVVHLADHFNPFGIGFPYVSHFGKCECKTSCRVSTCMNGSNALFCTPATCRFKGNCGNGLATAKTLRLMKSKSSSRKGGPKIDYSLVTCRPLARDVAIGQYLGRLTFEPVTKNQRSKNEGYRFHMHRESEVWGRHTVCINAQEFGSILRFCNHSCTPNADFHEVSYGRRRTVVVVTLRVIKAGEEITVNYGDDLWFTCRCQKCKEATKDHACDAESEEHRDNGSEEDDGSDGEEDDGSEGEEEEEDGSEGEEEEEDGSEGEEEEDSEGVEDISCSF